MSVNAFAGPSHGYDSSVYYAQRKNSMCDKYRVKYINTPEFSSQLVDNGNGSYRVDGKLNESISGTLQYIAAAPPTVGSSFSGSNLPFANEDIAFVNTPNKGVTEVKNGRFTLNIRYPNSYYEFLGKVFNPPQVILYHVESDKEFVLPLGGSVPFRTLSHPENRTSSLFYSNENLPIRTQANIIKDSAYPQQNFTPENFWGLRPAR